MNHNPIYILRIQPQPGAAGDRGIREVLKRLADAITILFPRTLLPRSGASNSCPAKAKEHAGLSKVRTTIFWTPRRSRFAAEKSPAVDCSAMSHGNVARFSLSPKWQKQQNEKRANHFTKQ